MLEVILTVYLTYTLPMAALARGKVIMVHMTNAAIDYDAARTTFIHWMVELQAVTIHAVCVGCYVMICTAESWRPGSANPLRIFPFTTRRARVSERRKLGASR